jgi:hypothetical protein
MRGKVLDVDQTANPDARNPAPDADRTIIEPPMKSREEDAREDGFEAA